MSNEIRLVQLNSYVRPKLQENKTKKWVMNGINNDFYQYIIDRYNGSPTNAAIINSYIDLIYGRGLTSDDKKAVELLNECTDAKEIKKIVSDKQLFGEAYIQVIAKIDSKNLPEIKHIATNKVIPEIEDEEGVINAYWFSNDWKNTTKPENKPERYPAFGNKAPITILKISPYKAGKNYFADPEYLAGLPYAEMEEEIANYCINHIQNGLSFGYIINIPGGANWDPEQRAEFERKIKTKLTGSQNAGKFILAFNGADVEVTVVPLNINDAHKQWDFLTQESRQQLLTAHRVTSPMLFGIKDNTGLGNNAEELDTAEIQLYKRVIKPKQQYVTDAIASIFRLYGHEFEFYFIPLTEVTADASKSFDSGQLSSAMQIIQNVNSGLLTEEQGKSLLASMLSYPQEELENIFKQTPQKKINDDVEQQLHEHGHGCGCDSVELNETPIQKVIDSIADEFVMSGEKEEDILEEFEMIMQDDEAFNVNEKKLNESVVKLARSPLSYPNRKSKQDTSLFKIRYQYKGAKEGQREFCKKVLKENRVYRWEDLENASKKVVNKGFGLKGADTYDIAKYKGGVNCKHFWQRKIYLRRNNKALKSVNEARRMILALPPDERDDARWVQNPKEVAQVASPSNNFWKAS